MMSKNRLLILKPYTGSMAIKSTGEKQGFSSIQQKVAIVGLELLMDSCVDSLNLVKGTLIYFKEEDLHNHEWSKKIYSSNAIKEKFIIAPKDYVVFTDEGK